MATLKIIVCGNSEKLGCSANDAITFAEQVRGLARDGIEIEVNSEFDHWNGGIGVGCRQYVDLDGSRVVGLTGKSGSPSRDEAEAAFALLDEVRRIRVLQSAG